MFSENYAGIWHRDASVRIETLRNRGLDAMLRLELVGKLWALVVEPHDRDDLPRLALPWKLHVSLCFEDECVPQLLADIRAKWHGRRLTLWFSNFGSGGSGALSGELASCPLVRRAHKFWWYSDRDLHISF